LYNLRVATRKIAVSEARRLLPALVRSIARDGGRVDITYRGEPRVSLLRFSDVKSKSARQAEVRALPAALQVELSIPAGELVGAIRELRSRQGRPRADWLSETDARPRKKRARRSGQR